VCVPWPPFARQLAEAENTRFLGERPRSMALQDQARGSMPRGVPMAWMDDLYDHPPVWVSHGEGARFTDVDGHTYLERPAFALRLEPGSSRAVRRRVNDERLAAPAERGESMEYGAHLPLIDFEGAGQTPADLRAYARRAAALGYSYLCANDHLLFGRPWLDGPSALAASIEASGDMTLATTVCLPVIRGPVQSAKTLAALDLLSGGRLVAGVGPGSSARDYAAVGVPFQERWQRFDEAVRALRSLLAENAKSFVGRFYSTEGISLEPPPSRPAGPPIWVASWGSPAGLRRVARLGDGWLASGYNTTPSRFASSLARLYEQLEAAGDSRGAFPNALVTMWLYVSEDRRDADRMLGEVLAPMLGRPIEALRDLALPIGSAEQCAERISEYQDAGAERIFVWPLANELHQLERFREEVVPLVPPPRSGGAPARPA
jgi:alkanesulfonate monooxygenase SsuD/methylene tetrahydromethanopterin reductase-like flavin-dependent oxidoreductase (luciferase family)